MTSEKMKKKTTTKNPKGINRNVSYIVLPRSNDHGYICLFVNIEIKTLGWHIQQSGAVLITI